MPATEAYIYAEELGSHSATITTSEGVSKTISVMVKPHPVQVSEAETANTKITLNKKPGQTFSYKIDSCYKKNGAIVCNSLGNATVAITAPYKTPVIKTAKQSGSTKYEKPYTYEVTQYTPVFKIPYKVKKVKIKGNK